METVQFYTPDDEPYGAFSNFAWYGVVMDELYYRTVEHYYQAAKFLQTAPDYAEKIRGAPTPKRAATMGRNRSHPVQKNWDDVKVEVMRGAVRVKFETHAEIRELLLGTGDAEIVEASADRFWGAGYGGGGQNWLGRILMGVRADLRDSG